MGKLADDIDELYDLVYDKERRVFINDFIRKFDEVYYICKTLYEKGNQKIKHVQDLKLPDDTVNNQGYIIESDFGTIELISKFSNWVKIKYGKGKEDCFIIKIGNDPEIDLTSNFEEDILNSIYDIIYDVFYYILKKGYSYYLISKSNGEINNGKIKV